ncbi:hypothetical protein V865_006597 [Kwoniella europaea PYCC6329]|uniref:UDP-glucoronosyl and UDP-glucosyl transferase n=1 Tax=Kwoniella europaea PYCC6329 TaxID=1423913 RepID=A0AAX4KSH8_9TREE
MSKSNSRSKLLFLTCCEAGQANIQLSVINKLQSLHGEDLDIYLCSFESLKQRCPDYVTFLTIKGKGMIQHFLDKYDDSEVDNGKKGGLLKHLFTPPGFFGAIKLALSMTNILHAEEPSDYVYYAQQCEQIISDLDPDFIVCDAVFEPGRDAIMKLGRKCILLSPNTFKDLATAQQGKDVFKWPCPGTGYPYPLPWYLRPLNTLAFIFFAKWVLKYDGRHRLFNKVRNQSGFKGNLPMFQNKSTLQTKFLCVSNEKVEIPGKIPKWLKCCGPILLPVKPLESIDMDLYKWVMERPTVLIVLGTHYKTSREFANNMLISIRILLDKRKDVQVLWKLQKYGHFVINDGQDQEDRLKIVDWLKPDPLAILKTGNVVCFVNHGGSNSYHEGLATGTPQILMPAWIDCYDFAGRLSYFNNGVWGNAKAAPGISQPEFTKALLRVVGATPDAPEAQRMKARCKELSDIVTENGTREGSTIAAESIWEGLQLELDKKK